MVVDEKTVERIAQARREAGTWSPGVPDKLALEQAAAEAAAGADKPIIDLSDDCELHERESVAFDALAAWNAKGANGMPAFYNRARMAMSVVDGGKDGWLAQAVGRYQMRTALSEAASWQKYDGRRKAAVNVDPPMDYANSALEQAYTRFPSLTHICPHPVLVKGDGGWALRTERGYKDGVLITRGVERGELMDLDSAKALLSDLTHDLPFAGAADYAGWLACAMSAIIKPGVELAPMAVFLKPQRGTGGTLAMGTACAVGAGGKQKMIPPPTGGFVEENKAIFAALIEGRPYLPYENVVNLFGGASLSYALTAPDQTFTQRLLGVSEMRTVHMSSVFAMSSNGVRQTADMMRRSYPIHLARGESRPDNWAPAGGWRHPDIVGAAARREYHLAVVSLIAAWIESGAKDGDCEKIGSFEAWSGVVSGVLENAGIRGFLDGRAKWVGEHDQDQTGWDGIVWHWIDADGGYPIERTAAMLETMLTADGAPDLPFTLKDGDANKRTRVQQIGRRFADNTMRVVRIEDGTSWRIVRRVRRGNRAYYSLEKVYAAQTEGAGEAW